MNTRPDTIERYLSRLGKALQGADPAEREEILSDIRSLIQEHLDAAERSQAAVDTVLARLGSPEALAEAYRMEGLLARAAHSYAPLLLLKAAFGWALMGIRGFLIAIVLFTGYLMSIGCFAVGILKPFLPAQTGLWLGPGQFFFGFVDPHPGVREVLGWWAIPVGLILGLLFYVGTTRLARWFFATRAKALALKLR